MGPSTQPTTDWGLLPLSRGHASCTARPPSPHTAEKTPSDPLRGAVKPLWTAQIGGKELVDSPVGCELTEAGDSLAVDGATICVCADATVLDSFGDRPVPDIPVNVSPKYAFHRGVDLSP